MIQYGFPLLAGVAGFISGFNNNSSSESRDSDFYISSPVIDSLPQATNSAEFYISGQATSNYKVSVFVNNTLSSSEESDKDGSFSIKINLREGENKIKAQASKDDKKSDFSDEETIYYTNKPPKLEIKNPSDGAHLEKDQSPVQVQGTTDIGASVTVNDFWAVLNGENFSYTLSLQNGENNIKIVAKDDAGNKTEKTIKVTYSP